MNDETLRLSLGIASEAQHDMRIHYQARSLAASIVNSYEQIAMHRRAIREWRRTIARDSRMFLNIKDKHAAATIWDKNIWEKRR